MIVWEGTKEFATALNEIGVKMDLAAREGVVEVASLMEEKAKDNASHRPGPEVVTGTLRRGITQSPVSRYAGRSWKVELGPTAIYSRRVELGYYGVDSLGRSYATPGYPFFVPAYFEVIGEAEAILNRRFARELRI